MGGRFGTSPNVIRRSSEGGANFIIASYVLTVVTQRLRYLQVFTESVNYFGLQFFTASVYYFGFQSFVY